MLYFMDIDTLVNLTTRSWSLKILALIHDGVAPRQATLLTAAEASRSAFRQSLDHLQALGLLKRNPGHGHPLRPEFRLTHKGQEIAPLAARVLSLVQSSEQAALLRRTWSLPILAVTGQPRYFTDIKRALGPITDRALSQGLQHLQDQDWLQRQVIVEMHPPRPRYVAANRGAHIHQALVAS